MNLGEEDVQTFKILQPNIPMFGEGQLVSELKKGLEPPMRSTLGRIKGRVDHPINFLNAILLSQAVNIQETCIRAKRDATVGLGFETEEERTARKRKRELDTQAHDMAMNPPPITPAGPPKKETKKKPVEKGGDEFEPAAEEGEGYEIQISKAEEVLDPLCEGVGGFQSLLNQCGEDYENTGNAYIEVVRDRDGSITALWHVPAPQVFVVNEEEAPFFHFEVDNTDGHEGTLKYARFGELEDFKSRVNTEQKIVTELIHWKMPTAMSREYGLPSWLSCVGWLELAQKIMQYDFDYFNNRAVPDLMVIITGAALTKKQLDSMKSELALTVGSGNRHKTFFAAIPNAEAKIQVERLNADNRERFGDQWTAIQLNVVSTHRVPPLLAGVVLSGKMAAANELPNALVAFQTLYVQQQQRNIENTLSIALGDEEKAGLGLTRDDFHFKQITDYYDMGQMDTMSRMRESAVSAAQNGRKLEDGLKD